MRTWPYALIVLCLSAALLAGCGGGGGGGGASQPTRLTAPAGGGGGGSAVSAPGLINGTAASGAALAGATVTARDATGKTVAVTTDSGGNFFIDTNGLTLPLLIRADDGVHPPLFSIAFANGTANVTPLTSLVLSLYYAANGTTPMAAFAATPPVLPTPDRLAVIQSLIQQQIEQALTAAGLDPNQFDMFRTPFNADHAGFDGLLDHLNISSSGAGSTLTIHNGGLSTTSSLDANGVSGTVTVGGTITDVGSGDSSTSSMTTILPPVGSATAVALQSAHDLLSQFVNTVDTRGPALTADDLAPYLTADYLDSGENRTRSLARLATRFRGTTPIQGFQILGVQPVDPAQNVLPLDVAFDEGGPDGPRPPDFIHFDFQDDGSGHWLLHGNQQVADVSVNAEVHVLVDNSGPHLQPLLVYHALSPQDEGVTQVVVDATSTLDLLNAGLPVQLLPDGPTGALLTFLDDEFGLDTSQAVTSLDHTYNFQVKANGQVYTYPQHLHAFSSEGANVGVAFKGAPDTGHTLLDAHLDQPLTVQWMLPLTFAVPDLQVYGTVTDGSGNVRHVYPVAPFNSEPGSVEPTAGSVQITLPSTVTSATDPTVTADLFVSMRGGQGEGIVVDWRYSAATP